MERRGGLGLGHWPRLGFPVHARRITPEHFQVIECPSIFREDVDDDVAYIKENPLGIARALDAAIGQFVARGLFGEIVCKRARVAVVSAGADDKEVGNVNKLSHIEDHDVLGELVG